jgi:hypothetical protein
MVGLEDFIRFFALFLSFVRKVDILPFKSDELYENKHQMEREKKNH